MKAKWRLCEKETARIRSLDRTARFLEMGIRITGLEGTRVRRLAGERPAEDANRFDSKTRRSARQVLRRPEPRTSRPTHSGGRREKVWAAPNAPMPQCPNAPMPCQCLYIYRHGIRMKALTYPRAFSHPNPQYPRMPQNAPQYPTMPLYIHRDILVGAFLNPRTFSHPNPQCSTVTHSVPQCSTVSLYIHRNTLVGILSHPRTLLNPRTTRRSARQVL